MLRSGPSTEKPRPDHTSEPGSKTGSTSNPGAAKEDAAYIDYYEVLQVSPNVDAGTIERVFRYLAKRYHPDNPGGGSPDHFDLVMKAYRVLSDQERRAAFDVQHRRQRGTQEKLVTEAADTDDLDADRILREQLLSLLYVKRRRDLLQPGIGGMELERLLDRPREVLAFHIWYLREKGWIERTEEGYLAITANGVEQVEVNLRTRNHRMIEDRSLRERPRSTST